MTRAERGGERAAGLPYEGKRLESINDILKNHFNQKKTVNHSNVVYIERNSKGNLGN